MKALLFFLFYLYVTNACLIIGYSEPPACACKTLMLGSSNIFDNVQKNNSLYLNVTGSNIEPPLVTIDDCSGSMFCDGDYSLFVFDTDKEAVFGAYAAEGICQPFTQTWLVDKDGVLQQYKELKGVCVKNSKCECRSLELDNSNIGDYYKNNVYYNENLKNHPIKPANLTYSEDGCQYQRSCDEGWEIRVFVERGDDSIPRTFAYNTAECGDTYRWYLRQWMPGVVAGIHSEYLAPICVDFSRTI